MLCFRFYALKKLFFCSFYADTRNFFKSLQLQSQYFVVLLLDFFVFLDLLIENLGLSLKCLRLFVKSFLFLGNSVFKT